MPAEQLHKIQSTLQELVTSFEKHPRGDYCAQFNLAGAESPWVQVVADEINFFYPFDDDPSVRLKTLAIPPAPSMHCVSWKPGTYVTLELDDMVDLKWLVRFIDGLFTSLFGCGPGYEIDAEVSIL